MTVQLRRSFCLVRLRAMVRIERDGIEIARELDRFAKAHRLLLASHEHVKAHVERFTALGHCPCVESRMVCPCDEALTDIQKMGRCECAILIDPLRLCPRSDRPE